MLPYSVLPLLVRRGVVVGWDAQCCEVDEWMADNSVAKLSKGSKQPFYHVGGASGYVQAERRSDAAWVSSKAITSVSQNKPAV